MKKQLYLWVPLLAVILCSMLFFTSMDNKVFDLFLRVLPSLEEDPSVVLINIDDVAIEEVGIFPWTRDVLAESLILMKELGAEQAVFDLSYLDRSPQVMDPYFVENVLPQTINQGFDFLDQNIAGAMDGVATGFIGPEDVPFYAEILLDTSYGTREDLIFSLDRISRDADQYFGQTLRFFGDSYLTLSMVTPETLLNEDDTFDMSPYNREWLEENLSLNSYISGTETKSPIQVGIIPALDILLEQSNGAGFVNAPVDPDGYRRRLHLLQRFNDHYYGQFTFFPLWNRLGRPEISVSNRNIELLGTEYGDIRIPRSQDGTVLIQWPKKDYEEYNDLSAWDLIQVPKLEQELLVQLNEMEKEFFFTVWDQGATPQRIYLQAEALEQEILQGVRGQESMDQYRELRQAFFTSCDSFLNGPYEAIILEGISQEEIELIAYIQNFFARTREQLGKIVDQRNMLSQKLEGSYCLFGVSASSMTDYGLTTFQEFYPNVGIHATLANMILSQSFLDDSPFWISLLIAILLAIGISKVIEHMDTLKSMIYGIGSMAVLIILFLLFFRITRIYIGLIVPLVSLALTFISLSAWKFLVTIKEKSFLRSAFSRYLSPVVINELIDDPDKLNLGGENRELTAIFTDIRGFSTIAEGLDPTELVKLLNIYLSEMSDIVMENQGTIDKYEGDAIIAFFGAPLPMENHAAMACKTAIAMKKAEAKLNKRFHEEGLSDKEIFTRIGINTGDMVVGNMGTANKMDYTIMGNSVNLAARLEGVNKQYNTRGILISQHTREQIGEDFLLRRLDRVRVYGVNTPLQLFELIDMKDQASEDVIALQEEWEKAMDLFDERKYDQSTVAFQTILDKDKDDGVAGFYIKRSLELQENPREKDWDGVFTLSEK